jgi:hypothetical protein
MSDAQAGVGAHPIRVFISYSHDSLPHMERVVAFSNNLRAHGIESVVDRYFEDTLDMRWTDWMQQEIEAAKFVLIVATPGYAQHLKPGSSGSLGGTNFEGVIITQNLYQLLGRNEKFFAVYFEDGDRDSIPIYLAGYTNYKIGDGEGYKKLYRRLTNQPGVVPPVIGVVTNPNVLYTQPPAPNLSSPHDRVVKERIEELGGAYQQLRKSMLPSDARTRKMEIIAAKMRALACDAYFMLDYLAKNPEPGCRLAAVSLLEVKPNPEYLEWLCERLAPEKPFVGYHAALALIAAARVLGASYQERTNTAIEKARRLLGPGLENTDRARALKTASRELSDTESIDNKFSLRD